MAEPAKYLLLLSKRNEDIDFFKKIAAELALEFKSTGTYENFISFTADIAQSISIIDCDFQVPEGDQEPYPLEDVRNFLEDLASSERVIALTDKPLIHYQSKDGFKFLHNLIRNETEIHAQMTVLWLKFLNSEDLGFMHFFNSSTKPIRLEMKHTAQRGKLVEAVQNLLQKQGIERRLAARVAQTTDELLLNAVYDAPRDHKGMATLHGKDKTVEFEIEKGKSIVLELSESEKILGLNVIDQYGSITIENFLKAMSKDFSESKFSESEEAGKENLGFYAIIQGGITLLIHCKKNTRTQAMFFFTKASSYKEFKKSFQFYSFILQ